MEIREQPAHDPKWEGGMNENAGAARARNDAPLVKSGHTFKNAHCCRADRHDAVPGFDSAMDRLGGGVGDFKTLLVQGVPPDGFGFHRRKGGHSDVQRDRAHPHSARADRVQELRGEMQSRGRRSH